MGLFRAARAHEPVPINDVLNRSAAFSRSAALMLLLAVAALLAFASSANAAMGIPSYTNVPSSTAASANATLATDFTRSGTSSDDLKTAQYHLPAGSNYSLASVPKCSPSAFSLNACPVSTRVGDTTLRVYEAGLFGDTYTNIDGKLYALSNTQIGIKYTRLLYGVPNVTFTIGTSPLTGGPMLTSSNYPQQIYLVALIPTSITASSLSIDFYGRANPNRTGPVVYTNPSFCTTAQHKVVATSYSSAASVTKSGSWTPNPCIPGGDDVPPNVTILDPEHNSQLPNSTTVVHYTATDNVTPSASLVCTPANGATVPLNVGDNTITVSCTDAAGNTGSASVNVNRGIAPGASIDTPEDGFHTTESSADIEFSYTGSEPMSCFVNGNQTTSPATVALVDGDNTVTLTCENDYGSVTETAHVLKGDAPDVTITSPDAGSKTSAASTSVAWTAPGTPDVSCVVNGSSATSPATVALAQGDNTITVTCTNDYGTDTQSVTVTRGNPPVPHITSPPPVAPGPYQLTWNDGGATPPVSCTVNGTPATSPYSMTIQLGANTITVSCDNDFGSGTVTATYNVSAPIDVFITSPAHGAKTSASSIPVYWTVNGGAPPIQCTLNGTPASSGDSVPLGMGSNSVIVSCAGANGGSNSDSIIVTRGNAPQPVITSPANGTHTTLSSVGIIWTVNNAPLGYVCTLNGTPVSSSPITFSLQPGDNVFTITCSNEFGSASYTIHVFRGTAPYDVEITSPPPTGPGPYQLTWAIGNEATPPVLCTVNGTPATSPYSMTIQPGSNTVTVSCNNDYGSDSATANFTFGPSPNVTITTPVKDFITTASSIAVTWTDGFATAPVSCTLNGNPANSGDSASLVMGSNTITVTCSNAYGSDTDVISGERIDGDPFVDTTITSFANPSAGTPSSGPAVSPPAVQFSGINATGFQCAVTPFTGPATLINPNSVSWTACSSPWTIPTASLSSPAQYAYLVRGVNASESDPTPAQGYFWNDNRTFTASPSLQYFSNTLVGSVAAADDAGAHPTLAATLDLQGADDYKSTSIITPDGLMGSLKAIPQANRCTY